MVADVLGRDPDFKVSATVRSVALAKRFAGVLPEVEWRVFDVAAGGPKAILEAITGAHWVVNAVGITKPYVHDDSAAEVERCDPKINSLFPYGLG